MSQLHGQWTYCNQVVHNITSGTSRDAKKWKLQEQIDVELECGLQDLRPEDFHLMSTELDNLASTSGEKQE